MKLKRSLAVIVPVLTTIVLAAAAIESVCESSIGVQELLLDDSDRKRKKHRRNVSQEYQPLMSSVLNNPDFHESPQFPLEKEDIIEKLMRDGPRNYCKGFTRLYGWELFALADHLKDKIEAPRRSAWREDSSTKGEQFARKGTCKHDYVTRLYLVLNWLANGESALRSQFHSGWAKTSCNEDIPHVLHAIIEGLDDEIRWPDREERGRLADEHDGIFKNCIGIMDIMEHPIRKPSNCERERATFSGKEGCNTLMTFAVIDSRGYYRYVQTGIDGHRNDREAFTSLPLYMNKGAYFDGEQFIAADGGFEGDGPIRMSYKDMGGDEIKEIYNLAFKEVRMQVENAFGRIQSWFGILGNESKKWKHSEVC